MIGDARQILLTVFVCLSVLLAGCAGWGTASPSETEGQTPQESGDLEATNDDDTQNAAGGNGTPVPANDSTDRSEAGESNDDGSSADTATDASAPDDGSQDGNADVTTAGATTADEDANDDSETDTTIDVDDAGTVPEPDETGDDSTSPDDATDDGEETNSGVTNETPETGSEGSVSANSTDSESSTDSDSDGESAPDSDTDADDENGSDSDSGAADESVPTETATDEEPEREVHNLTVTAGEAFAVPNVPVTIERASDGATTTRETNADGVVTFTVYDDEYVVTGTDPNGNEAERTVTVDGEDQRVLLETLEPEWPEETTLTVTVLDSNGDPVEGATVEGTGDRLPNGVDALASAETNAEGVAELSVWNGMSYLLDVTVGETYVSAGVVEIDGETDATIRLDEPTETEGESEANVETADMQGSPSVPALV